MKKDPTEGMDPKLVAMLNETKTFLEDENRQHQFLINKIKLDKFAGKAYIDTIENFLNPKKKLVQRLGKFKLPSLKAARKFLQKSARQDKSFELGGKDYMERVVKFKKRMAKDIETKKNLIAKLKSDLGEPAEKS